MIQKNRPKSPVPAAATITLANIFCNVTWVRPAEITWPTPSLWLLIVYSYNNLIMYPTIFFVISVSALFKNPSYVFLIREVYSLHTYTHTHRHTHIYMYMYVYMYINTYYYYCYYYIGYYMGSTPLTAPSPSRTPFIQKRGSSVAPWRCSAIQSSRRSTSKLSWPPAKKPWAGSK